MPNPIKITSVPEMINMWDFEGNKDIDPDDILVGSSEIFLWKHLEKNHSFHASPRTIRHGHGCTICSGKEIAIGINDLKSQYPDLCEEWDYKKNKKNPEEFFYHSGKEVYWECKKCGHKWKAPINNRTKGAGCLNCSTSRQTSFPEQAVFYFVSIFFDDALMHFKLANKYTLDIYIPKIKTAIEYDGYAWHSNKINIKRDKYKDDYCSKQGIKLIRLKEQKEKTEIYVDSNSIIFYRDKNDDNLSFAITKLLSEFLNVNIKKIKHINIKKSKNEILNSYKNNILIDSLATRRPDLLQEWDYEKNNPLKPDTISANSNDEVHWICKKYKHSFSMSVDKRNSRNFNCPYCSGRRLLKGFNDLRTWCINNDRKDMIIEWNDITDISDHMRGDKKPVSWKCRRCGDVWVASILTRTQGFGNCEKCTAKLKYKKVAKISKNNQIVKVYSSISKAANSEGLIKYLIEDAVIDKKLYAGFGWELID